MPKFEQQVLIRLPMKFHALREAVTEVGELLDGLGTIAYVTGLGTLAQRVSVDTNEDGDLVIKLPMSTTGSGDTARGATP